MAPYRRPRPQEMAAGVRRLCGADIGLAVTGIAGPGGATDKKPMGLVYMHLSAENYDKGMRQIFTGSREVIKLRSEYYALNLVREYLNQYRNEQTRESKIR